MGSICILQAFAFWEVLEVFNAVNHRKVLRKMLPV